MNASAGASRQDARNRRTWLAEYSNFFRWTAAWPASCSSSVRQVSSAERNPSGELAEDASLRGALVQQSDQTSSQNEPRMIPRRRRGRNQLPGANRKPVIVLVIPAMFTSRMSPVTGNVRIAIRIFNDHSIEAREYLIGIARLKCVPKGLKGEAICGAASELVRMLDLELSSLHKMSTIRNRRHSDAKSRTD